MFVDENAFDVDEVDTGFNRVKISNNISNGRSRNETNMRDDDNGDGFGSAGALAPQASSRARMLAQQRELQLKRRQAQMQSAGMVRSSVDSGDSSPHRGPGSSGSGDNQFTPAMPQFSAPKVGGRGDPTFSPDSSRQTEFNRPTRPMSSSGVNRGPGSSFQPAPPAARTKGRDDYRGRDEDSDEEYGTRGRGGGNRYDDDRRVNRNYDDNRRRDYDDEETRPAPRGKPSRRDYDDEETRPAPRSNRRDYDDEETRPAPRGKPSRRDYDDEEARPAPRSNRRDYDDEETRPAPRGKPSRRDYDDEETRPAPRSNRRDYDDEDDDYVNQNRKGWNKSHGRNDSGDADVRERSGAITPPTTASTARPTTVPSAPTPLNLTNMRSFLTSPIPKGSGVVQCQIRRNKSGTNKLYPVYTLYLKDGDRFLLQSRKRANNKTSNYLITMGENDFNRESTNYLGKLRSNFVGTEFQVYDNGVAPKSGDAKGEDDDGGHNTNPRKELGGVMYAANVMGSRGPRKMQAAIPAIDAQERMVKWKSSNSSTEDLVGRIKDRNMRDIIYMINKPPRWNDQVGAYVLNFNGRVTMASVKNFQLVDPEDQNSVILQFGRVGKEEFTMDMQWPISPLQAFGITLSSFDSKIACD